MTTTHYIATFANGQIPASVRASTPVNLADHLGDVIDHPNPGRPWFDESPFSYFRTYTRTGEVLEDWQLGTWPARLWVVEPTGPTGNWAPRNYPYWVLTHQLRVVEETDAWRALGPRGRQVLDYIERDLPEQARQWAAAWTADPEHTAHRYGQWYTDSICRTNHCNSGEHAISWADSRAETSRREGAMRIARSIARSAASRAIGNSADVAPNAGAAVCGIARRVSVHVTGGIAEYVGDRAALAVTALLVGDRLTRYELEALRGADLDNHPVSAAA